MLKIILDKKVIEEITTKLFTIVGNVDPVIEIHNLLTHSKEVEVVDIEEIVESWRKARTYLTFISYLEDKGYKLIKIKE